MKTKALNTSRSVKRCAAYVRVSTEEQAAKEYSSLDAQQERIAALVEQRKSDGWKLTETYRDAGFSAKDTNRPAMKQLIRDAQDHKFDMLIVYKFDRLSRSVLDGARLMEFFKNQDILFVSVTENFDTATPSGELMVNNMFSMGQWERRMISTRTKDKIVAERAKGMWTGGCPPLGYDLIKPKGLKVNPKEAEQVQTMFRLYLEQQSLDRALKLINGKYRTKRWTPENGQIKGGKPFFKSTFIHILKNPLYIGKVRCHDDLADGQHEAIIEPKVFEDVQQLFARNFSHQSSVGKNKKEFLLKGLIHCAHCQTPMTSYHVYSRTRKLFRYYRCVSTTQKGYDACPVKWVPADEVEKAVIQRLSFLWDNPTLIEQSLKSAQDQASAMVPALKQQLGDKREEGKRIHQEAEKLFQAIGQMGAGNSLIQEKLEQLDQRKKQIEIEITELEMNLEKAKNQSVDAEKFRKALAGFGEKFKTLDFLMRQRLLSLVVQRIDYDKALNKIRLSLYPLGGKNPTGISTPPDVRQVCAVWLPR